MSHRSSNHQRILSVIHGIDFHDGVVTYEAIERLKGQLVHQALKTAKGNVGAAARLLRVNRDRLRYQMRKMRLRACSVPPAHSS